MRDRASARALLVGVVAWCGAVGVCEAQRADSLRLMIPRGHSQRITSLAFSANGALLASGALDRSARIWELATGREVRVLTTPGGPVREVAFAASDSVLVVVSEVQNSRVVHRWDVRTGVLRDSSVSPWVTPDSSPDARAVAERARDLGGVGSAGAFNRDATRFALGFTTGRIEIRKSSRDAVSDTVSLEIRPHALWITRVALSPYGAVGAVVGYGGQVRTWETATGHVIRSLQVGANVRSIAFLSADTRNPLADTLLVIAGESFPRVRLWNLRSGVVATRNGPTGFVQSLAVSPEGRDFAAVASLDGAAYVWRDGAATALRVRMAPDSGALFTALVFPHRDTLIVGDGRGRVSLVAIPAASGASTPILLDSLPGTIAGMALSRDRDRLTVVSLRGVVRVYDLRRRAVVASRAMSAQNGPISLGVAFADSLGTTVVVGVGPKAYVLRAAAGGMMDIVHTLSEHAGDVTGFAVSPNFRSVISASQDGTTRVWQTPSFTLRLTRTETDTVDWAVVAPDGRFDGSAQAVSRMHYARGLETIGLEAFARQYDTPGLSGLVLADSASHVPDMRMGFRVAARPIASYDSARSVLTVQGRETNPDEWTIDIFHNGKRVASSDPNDGLSPGTPCAESVGGPLCRAFTMHPVAGDNVFEARLRAASGESERVRVQGPRSRQRRVGRLVILGIGITEYSKMSEARLPAAVSDVRATVAALRMNDTTLFESDTAITLYDAQATKARILEMLAAVERLAKPEDVFVLLYAGHGVLSQGTGGSARYYLVPSDGSSLKNADSLRRSALLFDDLQAYFNRVKALKRVLIMDACHSGVALTTASRIAASATSSTEQTRVDHSLIPQLVPPQIAVEERAVAQLARSTGVVTIAATGTRQVASEIDSLQHGAFTYALLHALGDPQAPMPPGPVSLAGQARQRRERTVFDIIAALQRDVPVLSQRYRTDPQFPRAVTTGQDFPLVVR